MKNRNWILVVLALAMAAQGCSSSDGGAAGAGGSAGTGGSAGAGGAGGAGGGAPADTDRDGIPDADDPTPTGSSNNKLNGTHSGGAASVVAITATIGTGVEDVDYVYDADLTVGCDVDDSWYPQGTLCDQANSTDSQETSTKQEPDSGASWYGDGYDDADVDPITGFLVIDACSDDSCAAVDFNQARVFQMFSDGKTTSLRLSVHGERGDTPPAWNDAAWETVTDFEAIGLGTNIDDFIVEGPTVITTGPHVTRYVRIEARNDGSNVEDEDEGYYTELRSVKLFSVSAPE